MTDVVILCGGLGTRLRSVLPPGYPKCLADINGRPFLSILLEHVRRQGFKRVILAAGYGVNYLAKYVDGLKDKNIYISGSPPTGTWQAIKNAKLLVRSDPFLVLNGDTFCALDYTDMLETHRISCALATHVAGYDSVCVGAFVLTKRLMLFKHNLPGLNIESVLRCDDVLRAQGGVCIQTTAKSFYDIGTPEGLERFRKVDESDIASRAVQV